MTNKCICFIGTRNNMECTACSGSAQFKCSHCSRPFCNVECQKQIEGLPPWIKDMNTPTDMPSAMSMQDFLDIFHHSRFQDKMDQLMRDLGPGYFYIRFGNTENSLTIVKSGAVGEKNTPKEFKKLSAILQGNLFVVGGRSQGSTLIDLRFETMRNWGKEIVVRFPTMK